MVTLATFYAVTLAVQLKLAAPGPACYPKIRMEAIKSLADEISHIGITRAPEWIDKAMGMMRFPCEVAAHFRDRVQMAEESLAPRVMALVGQNLSLEESAGLAARSDFDDKYASWTGLTETADFEEKNLIAMIASEAQCV
jgi:hypothetical protein